MLKNEDRIMKKVTIKSENNLSNKIDLKVARNFFSIFLVLLVVCTTIYCVGFSIEKERPTKDILILVAIMVNTLALHFSFDISDNYRKNISHLLYALSLYLGAYVSLLM
jgi:hypothetical protein